MVLRELVLLLWLVVVRVRVCVCVLLFCVFEEAGACCGCGEERLSVGMHSLARVQERLVSPTCSISGRSRFMRGGFDRI